MALLQQILRLALHQLIIRARADSRRTRKEPAEEQWKVAETFRQDVEQCLDVIKRAMPWALEIAREEVEENAKRAASAGATR